VSTKESSDTVTGESEAPTPRNAKAYTAPLLSACHILTTRSPKIHLNVIVSPPNMSQFGWLGNAVRTETEKFFGLTTVNKETV
jgi:hypothetical protein